MLPPKFKNMPSSRNKQKFAYDYRLHAKVTDYMKSVKFLPIVMYSAVILPIW